LINTVNFVRQAVKVFDELVQNPAIEPRVLVVDGIGKIVMPPHSANSSLSTGVAKLVQAGLQVSAANVSA
jgi:hypothetical protein